VEKKGFSEPPPWIDRSASAHAHVVVSLAQSRNRCEKRYFATSPEPGRDTRHYLTRMLVFNFLNVNHLKFG